MAKFDADLNITVWSKRAVEKLGYTRDEMLNTKMFDKRITPEHEKEKVINNLIQIKNEHIDKVRFDTIAIKKSGEGIFVRIHASALKDEQGDLNSVLLFIENIDEQKRLAKLLQNTQKMAAIGGWEYRPTEDELFWTDEVYEIHGLSPDEKITVDNSISYFTHGSRQKIRKNLERTINEQKPYDIEAEIETANGEVKWVRTMGEPVMRNNKLVKVTGTFQDITKQKQKEQEIYENAKEKEVLLAEIHHRVKNNLAIISGLLELKAMNLDNEEMSSILRQSQLRIKSMAIIHEALYEADDFTNLEFSDFVNNLLVAIDKAQRYNGKEIEITFSCDDSLELNVNQAIPSGLIINELITNAYKHAFTNQDKGTIELNIDYDPENEIVMLQVCDNGKGLPPDFLNGEKGSLGTTLIQQLSKQLDATLDLKNEDGSFIELRFKKNNKTGSSSQQFNFS